MSVFVPGEPALLLSRGEQTWRELVRRCGLVDLRAPRFRFIVSSWRRGGHLFDLDNLVDPVLAVVGARPTERQSLWATVELGDDAGVEITEGAPPPPRSSSTCVVLASAPARSIRTEERLTELVDHTPLGSDEPCGCELVLGAIPPASCSASRAPSSRPSTLSGLYSAAPLMHLPTIASETSESGATRR